MMLEEKIGALCFQTSEYPDFATIGLSMQYIMIGFISLFLYLPAITG